MKKQSTWFSHDSNASLDPKIIALTATHGIAGYGRWWRLVEILRAEERYRYNITTPFAYSVLAKELMCSTEEAKQFIHDCIQQYQLLHTDEEYIWSTSLCGRMEFWDEKKASLSERGKKSGEARRRKKLTNDEPIVNPVQTNCEPIRTNKTKQNETKQNQSPPFKGGGGGCQEKEEQKAEDMWQALSKDALADTNFTYPLISSEKITQQQLEQWLQAFNKILAFRNEAPKTVQEYRMHFLRWFKFRDPQKEDPATFLTPEPRNKAPVVISTQSFLKTPQQIEEEQRMQHEGWKTATIE